jgi:hypothetical protein
MPVICPTCQIFLWSRRRSRAGAFTRIPAPVAPFLRLSLAAELLPHPFQQALQPATGSPWPPPAAGFQPPRLQRRLALHAGRAGSVRNAPLPRNARSRVQRYIQSVLPPPRPPAPERLRPIPRLTPHFRRATGRLLHRKTMTLRSPPQQVTFSSRSPELDPQDTRKMRRHKGNTTAASVPIQGAGFKKPAAVSRAGIIVTPAMMQICR